MKKWMLLLGWTLVIGSSVQAMQGPFANAIPDYEPSQRGVLANDIDLSFEKCYWKGFLDCFNEGLEWYLWKLSKLNIDQLNTPCKLTNASGLFEACLMEEQCLRSGQLKVLQHLIVNGLDVEVKKNERYVFLQYGDKFLSIFEGLEQYTFKKPLSDEFKRAYEEYKAHCAQEARHTRATAEGGQRPIQENRVPLLDPMKKPLLCVVIGAAALCLVKFIYKKYSQRVNDVSHNEETDRGQQLVDQDDSNFAQELA